MEVWADDISAGGDAAAERRLSSGGGAARVRYRRRDAGIAKAAEVEREERELNGDVTTPFEQS
jgi:hypothetical protein